MAVYSDIQKQQKKLIKLSGDTPLKSLGTSL